MSDKHLDPSTASSEQAAKTQRTAPTKINPVGRRTFLVLVAICTSQASSVISCSCPICPR